MGHAGSHSAGEGAENGEITISWSYGQQKVKSETLDMTRGYKRPQSPPAQWQMSSNKPYLLQKTPNSTS